MRVLLATMQFGPGYTQGTERYVRILCDGLAAAGHEPFVLAGDPGRRRDAAFHDTGAADLGRLVGDDPPLLHFPSRGWMTVRGCEPEPLAGLLREQRIDLVHLANPGHVGLSLLEAAASAGAPSVVTVMDYWWLCPKHTLRHWRDGLCPGRRPWRECLRCIAAERDTGLHRVHRLPAVGGALLPALFFGRWLAAGVPLAEVRAFMARDSIISAAISRAAAVIFPSQTAEQLVGPFVAPERRVRVPYGLEPHWFERVSEHRDVPAGRPESLTIGYAGALADHKGVHLLLEALRELGWRQTRVRIAGTGEPGYIRHLHELASELNVEFVGRIEPPQMPALLDSLDVLVVPSLWPENLPIIVLESCARRTPVLASRVGGIAELVGDDRDLFELGSAASLAACLRRFAADPVRDSLPRPDTAEQMVAATLDVYGRACALTRI